MSIFRAYDIRGVFDKDFNVDTFYLLGAGVARMIDERDDMFSPVLVGRDARLSSEALRDAFVAGLNDNGVDVLDVGVCTTPFVYFAVQHSDAGCGMMITASHNPREYNGLKLVNAHSTSLSPLKEARSLQEFVAKNSRPDITPTAEAGVVEELDIFSLYLTYLLEHANIDRPLRIAVDVGNGVAGREILALCESLEIEVFPLYVDPDGTFPHHQADPSNVNTLVDLQKKVVEFGCDFGVAFDGDADRAGFVNEKGEVIPNDIIGCLVASSCLQQKHQHKVVVHDLTCTQTLRHVIEGHNGKVIESAVGRHNVTHAMQKHHAVFGVEKSGHFFFGSYSGLDNAMLMFLHVAGLISRSGELLSSLVKGFHEYVQLPSTTLSVNDGGAALHSVMKVFSSDHVSTLDGVTVTGSEYRFTIRKSNTEPVVRFTAEATSQEKLDEVEKRVREAVGAHD